METEGQLLDSTIALLCSCAVCSEKSNSYLALHEGSKVGYQETGSTNLCDHNFIWHRNFQIKDTKMQGNVTIFMLRFDEARQLCKDDRIIWVSFNSNILKGKRLIQACLFRIFVVSLSSVPSSQLQGRTLSGRSIKHCRSKTFLYGQFLCKKWGNVRVIVLEFFWFGLALG